MFAAIKSVKQFQCKKSHVKINNISVGGLVNISMDCYEEQVSSTGSNVEALTATVCELSKARRFVSSYPQGHPLIIQSCAKVAELFALLFARREEVSLGVSRETLWVDTGSLELLAPAARNFATTLFYYGVALISFRQGITLGEVEKFSRILLQKRSEIAAQGGLERVLADAEIVHVKVSMIAYDAFRASDDFAGERREQNMSTYSLWEIFVQKVFAETDFPLHSLPLPPSKMDSGALATSVNGASPEILDQIIACLNDTLRSKTCQGELAVDGGFVAKVGDFVGRLSPDLRRRFFEGAGKSWQGKEDVLLGILSQIPDSAMLELREYALENKSAMPSYVQDVLAKLVDASVPGTEANKAGFFKAGDGKQDEICLLREEDVECFVPSDYLETLKNLIASQEIPKPESVQLDTLLQSLSSESIGLSVTRIIYESLCNASVGQVGLFQDTLFELLRNFLQSGDFRSLESMYDSVSILHFEPGHRALLLKKNILDAFEVNSFVEDVLDGLDIWGKPKFSEIGDLIQKIRKPFVEPLLERLSEVESITLRRYYLSQLTLLAELAKGAVLARLGDSRWYFLRNLLTILQHAGDPLVVKEVSRVASFPHPKVRYMVIETLLFFRSADGDRLLVRDLASAEHEIRFQAIQLAEKSVAREVSEALLDIVRGKRLSASDVLEKKAAVRALARIGNKRALPVLESVLLARRFFRGSVHKAIKKEIVSTLGLYRDPLALGLLQKMKKSSDTELSSLALAAYRAAVGEGV